MPSAIDSAAKVGADTAVAEGAVEEGLEADVALAGAVEGAAVVVEEGGMAILASSSMPTSDVDCFSMYSIYLRLLTKLTNVVNTRISWSLDEMDWYHMNESDRVWDQDRRVHLIGYAYYVTLRIRRNVR